MAETLFDFRGIAKRDAYASVAEALATLMGSDRDPIAAMATLAAIVHHGFGHLWTGFYRVVEPHRLLRVGPYQGTLGCYEIEFGRGVCGMAAAEGRTVIVPDVSAFPGHITCDARSRSEIVAPVFGAEGRLLAVFDIDSAHVDAFDAEDRAGVEQILTWFAHTETL
jgi:L-methionine (R)-S-oxide reductase